MQRWLYSGAVDALNGLQSGNAHALPALLATAFAFGMLHALLPGHGKAVLSAYYAGNGRVTGAIASTSLLIAVHVGLAIILVLAGFAIYQRTLGGAGRAASLQAASQFLIIAIGVWMLLSAFFGQHRQRSATVLAVAAGFIPCPLTTFVMTYAASRGATASGIALSCAFAAGMILTVALFPLLAIAARNGIITAAPHAWQFKAASLSRKLQIASALAIITIGIWPYLPSIAASGAGLP